MLAFGPSTPRTALTLAAAAVGWVLATIGVSASLYATLHYTHAIPFSDQWDLLNLPQDSIADYLRAIWAPHNEHRLVLFQLVNAADYFFFGYRNHLNAALLVMSMFANAGLLLAILRTGGIERRNLALWAAPAVLAMLFNGGQSENLSWALGLQWHLAGVFFLGALLALIRGSLTGTLLCSVLASLSSAHGLLVWPLLAIFALRAPLPRRFTFAYAGIGAAMWWLYLHGLPVASGTGSSVGDIAAYVALFLGHPWYYSAAPVGSEAAAIAAGTIALVATALLAFAAFASRRVLPPASRPIAVILLFVAGTALAAAIGRVPVFGSGQALAPRYGSASGLFWAALLGWLLSIRIADRRSLRIGIRLVAAAALSASVAYAPRMLDLVAGWHREREEAALALLVGVSDEGLLRRTYPNMQTLSHHAQSLRVQGKSIFGEPRAAYVGSTTAAFGRNEATCAGGAERLETFRFIDSGALVDHRISGWLRVPAAQGAPTTLVIATAGEGRIVGLASSESGRDDARAAWSGVSLPVTGNLHVFAVTGSGQAPTLCPLQ